MSARLIVHGELYLTLDVVAECYAVDVVWLRRVFDEGLLGPGEVSGPSVAIAEHCLDRVARICQLHFRYGVELEGIALFLRGPQPH